MFKPYFMLSPKVVFLSYLSFNFVNIDYKVFVT